MVASELYASALYANRGRPELVSFDAQRNAFSRSAMSLRSRAVTWAYRFTMAASDQPIPSITARSGTPTRKLVESNIPTLPNRSARRTGG